MNNNQTIDNHDATPQGALLFAQAIEDAREFMLSRPWVTESKNPRQEKAAAEQQLQHQISAALDQGFVMHDPYYPEFRPLEPHNQYGLYNPDNLYHLVNIETPGKYIIHGRGGTSADLQIQMGSGNPGFEPGVTNTQTISQLTSAELKCKRDGSFEIIISDTKEGENWMNNTDGERTATNILIRESFMDWKTERGGSWYIEREDTRGTPSPIPTAKSTNMQYERAAKFLYQSTKNWVHFVERIQANTQPNTLTNPNPTGDGGLTGQRSSIGLFALGDKEAIIVTLDKSDARYQSFQLGDLWFSSLEYRRRQTSLNMAQARASSDGRYRFVISREDPGVENWLDPAGASTVFAFLRWQGISNEQTLDQPEVNIVDLAELRKHLPDDEPHFSTSERIEQLAARAKASIRSPRGF